MSGIAPKQTAFKFKIAPHKQKSIAKKNVGRKMPLANVPKYNGKSGPEYKENNGRDVLDNNVDINAQNRNIGTQNNLRVFGSNKPKGRNRIAKIC